MKAEVGFTSESFETLKNKVLEEKEAGREVIVDLMVDEVSIRKKVEWTG